MPPAVKVHTKGKPLDKAEVVFATSTGEPAARSTRRSKKSVNAPVHLGGVIHRLPVRPATGTS